MTKLFLLLFLLTRLGLAESLFDPSTHALVIGVLEFKHSKIYGSFGKKDRRDAELVEYLRSHGAEVIFLKDGQATLRAIQRELPRVASACGPEDQLIVYYAGHGGKSSDGKDILFAPYDGGQEDSDNLSVEWMLETVKENFAGDRVLFLADCCSSGGLVEELEEHPGSLRAAALTSSSSNESSTGTWTFTQDVLDALRGNPLMDRNHDGKVTLNELATYARIDLSAYFGQMVSYATVNQFPGSLELGAVRRKAAPGEGERIQARDKQDRWSLARVVKREGARTRIRWMQIGWDTAASDEWKTADQVRPLPTPPTYPRGTRVEVEWRRKYWPAVVLKAQDGVHRIHYEGYGPEWDEWVGPRRIRLPGRAPGQSKGGAR